MTHIPRLAADHNPDDLRAALIEQGCCVVEHAVDVAVMDALADEMAPFAQHTPRGSNDFAGEGTRRTGMVVGRSAVFRTHLARHPVIVTAGDHVFHHAPTWNLSFAHFFELYPGEPGQPLHRDTWKYGAPPFPFEVDLNALWAVTDFTEDNGATRLVTGSNRWDADRRLEPGEDLPAAMPKGSVLLYTGLLFHGGGAHTGNDVRFAVNAQHSVGWLNQNRAPPARVLARGGGRLGRRTHRVHRLPTRGPRTGPLAQRRGPIHRRRGIPRLTGALNRWTAERVIPRHHR